MQRRVRDPIVEHSPRLCEYMNGHPTVVLSYARYFGDYPSASKATMTGVDQDGFDVTCLNEGQEQEVRVAFPHSLHAVSQVKDVLMTLAKEAETALRGKEGPENQGLMPDSPSASLPEGGLFYTLLVLFCSTMIYLDFYPNTTSPALQWVLQTFGPTVIHNIVLFVVVAHVFEALVSVYFTAVVGKGFFATTDIVQWGITVLMFGYPVFFKVVSLALRQKQARTKKQ